MAGKLLSAITGLIIYCSSGQRFAFSFLPTTPRDDAVAVWLALSLTGCARDLHPQATENPAFLNAGFSVAD